MIAHIAGLPFEETIPQLAPMVVGAFVAVRLLRTRARSWARSLHRRAGSSVLGALVLAVVALAWSATALADPGGNSAATITGSFSDRCRDFTAQSSKDISYVELRYSDGRVVRDETVDSPAYAIDGDSGDEVDAAVVKSYPTCLAWDPRTVWSRPPQGELGFVFVSPVAPESLTFSFRGTSSTDPDDDIASWSIDFGDGTSTSGGWTTEPPAEVTHSYYVTPSYTVLSDVTLTVMDDAGQSDSDTISLISIDGNPD